MLLGRHEPEHGRSRRFHPGGETVITLLSDDNFNSFLQRTVLLQFAVASESHARTPDAR